MIVYQDEQSKSIQLGIRSNQRTISQRLSNDSSSSIKSINLIHCDSANKNSISNRHLCSFVSMDRSNHNPNDRMDSDRSDYGVNNNDNNSNDNSNNINNTKEFNQKFSPKFFLANNTDSNQIKSNQFSKSSLFSSSSSSPSSPLPKLSSPIRKEFSFNQIPSINKDDSTISDNPKSSISECTINGKTRSKTKTSSNSMVSKKQRKEKSQEFLMKQKSFGSLNQSNQPLIESSSCPIYAKRNVVLRRKSVVNDAYNQSYFSKTILNSASVDLDSSNKTDDIPNDLNRKNSLKRKQSYIPQQTQQPHRQSIPLSKNAEERIHEIRVLSPRNSLKGVFYSASVIAVRNSNSNELQEDQAQQQHQQTSSSVLSKTNNNNNNHIQNDFIFDVLSPTRSSSSISQSSLRKLSNKSRKESEVANIIKSSNKMSNESELDDDDDGDQEEEDEEEAEGRNFPFNKRIQKFCIYFHWTSWMIFREEYSLFLFSPSNRLRKYCIRIADHPYFDYVVLIFISLNCITLAMERPKIPPHSREREFLNGANFVFTIIFGCEMLIKVIAKGLFYGKNAYFHNGWNIMDGSLVGISLFDIFLSFFAQRSPRIFGILRVFRLLRSLRPLRYDRLYKQRFRI